MLIKAGIVSILVILRSPIKCGNGYRVMRKPLVAGIKLDIQFIGVLTAHISRKQQSKRKHKKITTMILYVLILTI